MKEKFLRELQLKELEILKEIDRICTKHKIKYYLTWGSALGAIRHKGFIPWDDDIDISMPWDDYIRFEAVCKENLDNKFFLQTRRTDEGHYQPYYKIRMNNTTSLPRELIHIKAHWGICIDVFPLINIPTNKIQKYIQKSYLFIYLNICKLRSYALLKYTGKNILKIFIYKFAKRLSTLRLNGLENMLLRKITKYKNTPCFGEILDERYKKSIVPKSMFGNGIYIKFEDKEYPVPTYYHDYLTQMYGDYMKLPKEEDRIGHGDIIIDLEKGYENYLCNH